MTGNFEVLDMEKKAKVEKMRELLKIAACPNSRCQNGAILEGIYENDSEDWSQCQFCAERAEVLNG